jgi:hypothetical protein
VTKPDYLDQVTMNPEIKERWAAALESGEFRQGTGALRVTYSSELVPVDVRYCCLGVLTELYCRDTGKHWNEVTQRETATLPQEVSLWAGLLNTSANSDGVRRGVTDPYVRVHRKASFGSDLVHETCLSHANDTMKLPFTEIVRLVRESL